MLLDVGLGVLVSIVVSRLFSFPLTPGFVVGSIVFAFLVDLDFLFHITRGSSHRNAHRHRDLLHLPLLYIPAGSLITYFLGGTPWGLAFALSSLGHFIHDSIGIGWGVQWLRPFTDNHYSFFYIYKPAGKEKLPKKLLYIWKDNDIDQLSEKYGDESWFHNIYLKWHPYAIVEFLFFLFALIILLFYR